MMPVLSLSASVALNVVEQTPAVADLLRPKPDWWRDAACLEHPDVSFFLRRGESSAPAKAVCRSCLVREECLSEAITGHIDDGIFGGTSPRERRRMRRDSAWTTPRRRADVARFVVPIRRSADVRSLDKRPIKVRLERNRLTVPLDGRRA